ncbi:MAG: hypothetical protein ACYC1L_00725 [Alphaproteobacteria bacterium]
MNHDPKKDREALDRLADFLVDDVLNLPNEDILAEVVEGFGDAKLLSDRTRAIFESASVQVGKSKLDAAKKGVNELATHSFSSVRINYSQALVLYEGFVANDKNLSAKITLAARNGEKQSERDISSAIEDLIEIGAINRGDVEGSKV